LSRPALLHLLTLDVLLLPCSDSTRTRPVSPPPLFFETHRGGTQVGSLTPPLHISPPGSNPFHRWSCFPDNTWPQQLIWAVSVLPFARVYNVPLSVIDMDRSSSGWRLFLFWLGPLVCCGLGAGCRATLQLCFVSYPSRVAHFVSSLQLLWCVFSFAGSVLYPFPG